MHGVGERAQQFEITDSFPEDPAKSQYPHGGSEFSATPVSEDPTEFSDFTGILHT